MPNFTAKAFEELNQADLAAVLFAIEDLKSKITGARGAQAYLRLLTSFEGLIKKPALSLKPKSHHYFVFMACKEHLISGFCHVDIKDFDGQNYGFIFPIWLSSDDQIESEGPNLLDFTLKFLESKGCNQVDGIALPGNRLAKSLFESAGLKASLITMSTYA